MKDPDFLNAIRNLNCLVCGQGPVDPHHIKTVGSGGGDDWFNVIPLCRMDHTDWHNNKSKFMEKHPHVKEHLIKLGWNFSLGKMFHPEQSKKIR